jgi:thioredoxin-related protein
VAEVFNEAEFKTWASKKVVLLEVDFPQNHALPVGLKLQNRKLAKRYEISGYPTVLFLSADGKVVGRSGYREGGPKAWTTHADQQLSARR